MMVLTKGDDGKYTLGEGDFLSATVGSFTRPVTGEPVSSGQALILGVTALVGGVVIGRMFGDNIPLINNINS